MSKYLVELQEHHTHCIPDFSKSETVYCFSDYSGDLKTNSYNTYSFLLTDDKSVAQFSIEHKKIRQKYNIGKRKFSYKDLSDGVLKYSCNNFLSAANDMNGLLLSVAINKKMNLNFSFDGNSNGFSFLTKQKEHNVQRILRISHLAGCFIASILRPMQNILWITDNDNIVANDNFTILLTNIIATIVSSLVDFDLRHIRCGSSRCDCGDNLIEDLLSIPDFAAGILANQMDTQFFDKHVFWMHRGDSVKEKQNTLSWWLADAKSSLRKYIFILDPGSIPEKVITSFLHFYDQHERYKKA